MSSLPDIDWYLDHVVLPGGPPSNPEQLMPAARWLQGWHARATALDVSQSAGDGAAELASGQGFVITRAQAIEAGITLAQVRSRLRRGHWERQRRGVYSVLPVGRRADVQAALAATAAALSWPEAVISHRSAAILHGLPTRKIPDCPELTVVRNSVTGRDASIHTRRATLLAAETTSWFGAPLTSVARTVADIGRHDRHAGLMAADAALREALTTTDALTVSARLCLGWPGARGPRWIAEHANGSSESALESLTRACLIDSRLPVPELQWWITDPARGWRSRVDFCWPDQRVILEADGKIKYVDPRRRGDALWAEKIRQEHLERLGYRVVRVTWNDVVNQPNETLTRVRRALAR